MVLSMTIENLFRNSMQDSTANCPSRYWTFLFDNLKRSVEQIYQTCESDQNPLQCQVIDRWFPIRFSDWISFFPGSDAFSSSILQRFSNVEQTISTSSKSQQEN